MRGTSVNNVVGARRPGKGKGRGRASTACAPSVPAADIAAERFRRAMSHRAYAELLPEDVLPTHYDVRLAPDLTKFTFDGTVDILLTVSPLPRDRAKGGAKTRAPIVRLLPSSLASQNYRYRLYL